MKKFFINNISLILYVVASLILEITTNILVCGNPFIKSPWFGLSLLILIITLLSFIKKGVIRYYIASSLIFVQGAINIFCVILYDMTGTLFDFGMFNLRSDGMGILENIPMNFTYLYIFMLLLTSYLIFVKVPASKEEHRKIKWQNFANCIIIFVMATTNVFCIFKINNKTISYKDRLYISGNNYQMYGATSNFFNQIYKGVFFSSMDMMEQEKITSFIYENVSTPTENFGISEGNNLVTILAESLEWTAFIYDPEGYPNGLYGLTQAINNFDEHSAKSTGLYINQGHTLIDFLINKI